MYSAPGNISPILMANVLGDVCDIVVRAFQITFFLHSSTLWLIKVPVNVSSKINLIKKYFWDKCQPFGKL